MCLSRKARGQLLYKKTSGDIPMRKALFLLAIALLSFNAFSQTEGSGGSLFAVSKSGTDLGAFPLRHTDVKASISGSVARVNVRQEFANSFTEAIEAVYTFPLSQNGAVDSMIMAVGPRVIRGKTMKREEAREVYEAAKNAGQTAGILDQQRPNIFTQAVANIMPGETIIVELSYVETLQYEDGRYEFSFPMTVGPRYSNATVADRENIAPPVVDGSPGHTASIEVMIDAGVPIESIRSSSHEIDQVNFSPNRSAISLREDAAVPNKDFVLHYDVTGSRIEDALLTHRGPQGGFFNFILQPPDVIAPEDRTPKEIVFVLDTSGSMYGFPLEKAKEAMKLSLDGLYPEDTFNLITFSGYTRVLFDKPVPATQANLEYAQKFLETRSGGGGTEMLKAIKAAFAPTGSPEHLRIVCFMTDGYVGNEAAILAEIQQNRNARVFSFGIGNSVNRYLLDKMAAEGKGEVEYVSLRDDGSKAAKRFYERVRTPLLTDISIDWNGMPVADVYPSALSDLFSAKPVILKGRYTKPASGTIRLKGKVAGQEYVREIDVNFPENQPENDVLATLWARQRIDELSSKALGENSERFVKEITNIGLEFNLMTNYTSFVAVEEQIVNHSGTPTRVDVPVAVPEGVNRMMAGGDQKRAATSDAYKAWLNSDVRYIISKEEVAVSSGDISALPLAGRNVANMTVLTPGVQADGASGGGLGTGRGTGTGSGTGSGSGSGTQSAKPADPNTPFSRLQTMTELQRPPKVVSGGVMNDSATSLPKPVYPPAARAVGATGAVTVFVTIDETGKVSHAEAVSGHPLLRPAAVAAARKATFAPLTVGDEAVTATGSIIYNFIDPSNAARVSVDQPLVEEVVPNEELSTPQAIHNFKLKQKAHSWVYALIIRLQKNGTEPTANETAFVRDGKAHLKLVFEDKEMPDIDKLRKLGFEPEGKANGSSITGTFDITKIEALVDLHGIKYIVPIAK